MNDEFELQDKKRRKWASIIGISAGVITGTQAFNHGENFISILAGMWIMGIMFGCLFYIILHMIPPETIK